MDATRSSLEFPPPAWDEPTVPAGRGADDALVVAWMLTTCALVGLVLAVAAGPGGGQPPTTVLTVVVLAGWVALSARVLHRRRRD